MRSQRTLARALVALALVLLPSAAAAQLDLQPPIANDVLPAQAQAADPLALPSTCAVLAGQPSADPARPLLADGLSSLLQPLHLLCGHHTIAQGSPTRCGPVDEAAAGAGAPGPFAALITTLTELEAAAGEFGAPGGIAGQVATAVGGCTYPTQEVAPVTDPPPPPPPLAPPGEPSAGSPTATGASIADSSLDSGGPAASPPRPAAATTVTVTDSGPDAVTVGTEPGTPATIEASPATAFFPQAPFSTPQARSAAARAAAALLPLVALASAGWLGGGLTRRGRAVPDDPAA